MSISALASSTTTTTTSTSSSSGLGLDTSDFLTLMIEQLQNQNPTDPTDISDYMGQLIDLSNYETQLETSEKMDTIVDSMESMIAANGLGYIGQTVTAEGDTTTLQDGEATWSYTLDSDASDVTLTITDSDGNEVYSTTGESSEGTYDFTWDGVNSSGTQLEDGDYYTLTVTATDEDGATVDTSTAIKGTVTGIDSSTGTTYLMIGDVGVEMSSISSIVSS
ncbi:FlgD immunoglobulin-like domain containing protein [uncultured Cohaesibacter sp.]|uniref:flagellar hook assembly protein FlgD n=1 Tax=uncultured Cohaesibacter sp. TaxID=1002546 RepID=UPI0029C9A738|nr:FlgD immunoglobulin-like domain containing protein [uncultured Cohaesibacter sp.]